MSLVIHFHCDFWRKTWATGASELTHQCRVIIINRFVVWQFCEKIVIINCNFLISVLGLSQEPRVWDEAGRIHSFDIQLDQVQKGIRKGRSGFGCAFGYHRSAQMILPFIHFHSNFIQVVICWKKIFFKNFKNE